MINIKSKKAIECMIETGKRLSEIYNKFENFNFTGKTTKEIDIFIFNFLEKNNLVSKAKDYKGFLGYSCISLNNELVHGVPSEKKIISENDLLKIDICASYKGYCADMARMYTTNKENIVHKNFIEKSELFMKVAFLEIYEDNFLGNLGNAIKNEIEKNGFSLVKDFCGHGIGKNMHEDPEILNWGEKNKGIKIKYGMAFAVEPMFCEKKSDLYIDKDGWTAITLDGGLAGHIEDTVIVGNNGPIITTRIN